MKNVEKGEKPQNGRKVRAGHFGVFRAPRAPTFGENVIGFICVRRRS